MNYENLPLSNFKIETAFNGVEFDTLVTDNGKYVGKSQIKYEFGDRGIAPNDLKQIIADLDFGVWQSDINVDEKEYRGRNIGEALWFEADMRLSEEVSVVVRYVKDSTKLELNNWTSRHIKNVLAKLSDAGRDVEMLWEGKVGGNNAFLYIIRNL
ncbi:MAG TPA: hypothetical protein PLV59_03185 [Candidatus Dojkabacteria bacterium]|nr:hypothetical protein [Candidatus Dojkabacteria bacterium]